jgi:hypothetical protein
LGFGFGGALVGFGGLIGFGCLAGGSVDDGFGFDLVGALVVGLVEPQI